MSKKRSTTKHQAINDSIAADTDTPDATEQPPGNDGRGEPQRPDNVVQMGREQSREPGRDASNDNTQAPPQMQKDIAAAARAFVRDNPKLSGVVAAALVLLGTRGLTRALLVALGITGYAYSRTEKGAALLQKWTTPRA